jgi:hypothetical protein
MAQTQSTSSRRLIAENASVAVAVAGDTTLLELIVADINELGVSIAPTTNALDAFKVLGKFHPSGAFVTLYSTAGAYTSPAGLVVGASGDLTALAAAATGWLILNVTPLYAVRLDASAAVGISTVTTRAIGKAK